MADSYSVACGSTDITPREPIPLAGYATLRKATFDRIADPLEANVIALRKGAGTVVFVALDLMYVGAYLRDAIDKAGGSRVAAGVTFSTAVHTHSGPPTEDSLPILGAVTPSYRDFVAKRVGDLMARLLDGPFVPVSLTYCAGAAAHSVNRRKKVFGLSRTFPFVGPHVRIRPNLSGPRDETVHVLRIRNTAGQDVAACWSYACHPVGFPLLNDLSAEYPGFVRQMMRAQFGDMPVVFWQGFSGNTAPLQTPDVVTRSTAPAGYSLRASTMAEWRAWARGLGE